MNKLLPHRTLATVAPKARLASQPSGCCSWCLRLQRYHFFPNYPRFSSLFLYFLAASESGGYGFLSTFVLLLFLKYLAVTALCYLSHLYDFTSYCMVVMLPFIITLSFIDDWWLKALCYRHRWYICLKDIVASSPVCGYLVKLLPLSSSICHPTSYSNRCSHGYCPEWYRSAWCFSYLLFVGCDVWLCQFFAFGMLDFSCSFPVGLSIFPLQS